MSDYVPPPPQSGLARYRVFSPNAGVHVSPIQLGAMSIGDQWDKMGAMSKESSFKLLDAYFDNGGNFIDTACNYQNGTSEAFIGEWAEQRGIRDQLFIATKYSGNHALHDASVKQKVLFTGNSTKNMFTSIEGSLKRLRTSYIDLYYIHFWDWETSIEEVMRSLNVLVQQQKVLYLGVSDTPAWIVAKANAYARHHGLTPFSVYQGLWNVMDRSFEREIIPMARVEGLALAPWSVLAAGKIRTDEEEERRRQTGENGRTMWRPNWERNDKERKVCKALEKVAAEVGAKHITAVAIAYVMHKTPYVFPIIGGRKVEHLIANLDALEISLSHEQIKYLESATEFDPGFPNTMIGDGTSYWQHTLQNGHFDKQPYPEPIRPKPKPLQEQK
ncbi:Aryl-alcohol dehydrogenase [NADP(+)] [Leucoagaricus sp. SymC.cos]|nr:Aryl-alcohol dehydrogenase [NADP(+)] [Leucoagaricus sp. SymC.cos]